MQLTVWDLNPDFFPWTNRAWKPQQQESHKVRLYAKVTHCLGTGLEDEKIRQLGSLKRKILPDTAGVNAALTDIHLSSEIKAKCPSSF